MKRKLQLSKERAIEMVGTKTKTNHNNHPTS